MSACEATCDADPRCTGFEFEQAVEGDSEGRCFLLSLLQFQVETEFEIDFVLIYVFLFLSFSRASSKDFFRIGPHSSRYEKRHIR